MTADMHANWKEKVMEKFLNNATEMRGACFCLVNDCSSFKRALKKLSRKETRRIPTASLIRKFSPFVNARFLSIDSIHELFNFDETCRRQMQQLYQEYDETKETIVISMYIIDETKTNVYVDKIKPPDLAALVVEFRSTWKLPTDKEVLEMYPNDTAEAVREMANGLYEMLYTQCANCGAKNKPLKSCAKCRAVKYCSKECQKKNWAESHMKNCKLIGTVAPYVFKII